jgi:hypothetical protein
MLRHVSAIARVAIEADRDSRRVFGACAPRLAVVVPRSDGEDVALPAVERDDLVPDYNHGFRIIVKDCFGKTEGEKRGEEVHTG